MAQNPYYKQHKNIIDSEIYKCSPASLLKLWTFLQCEAHYSTEFSKQVKVRSQEVQLKQGEVLVSRSSLALELGCDQHKAYRLLNQLESLGKIKQKTSPRYSIITILVNENEQQKSTPSPSEIRDVSHETKKDAQQNGKVSNRTSKSEQQKSTSNPSEISDKSVIFKESEQQNVQNPTVLKESLKESLSKEREERENAPPIFSYKKSKGKTEIPENFSLTPELLEWGVKEGHKFLKRRMEVFIEKCKIHAYRVADWDLYFKRSVRDDWGNVSKESSQLDKEGNKLPEKQIRGIKKSFASKPTPSEIRNFFDLACGKIPYPDELREGAYDALTDKLWLEGELRQFLRDYQLKHTPKKTGDREYTLSDLTKAR